MLPLVVASQILEVCKMQLVLGMVSRIGLKADHLFEYWHRDYSIGLGDRVVYMVLRLVAWQN